MIVRALSILAIIIAYAPCIEAQPEVSIEPVPDWAVRLELEEFEKDRSDEFLLGVAQLLLDRQIRRIDGGFEYVFRTAYRVVDRSGLENSARIVQAFDPESETLAFNFVRVLRDGTVDDRLPEAEIALLRQEDGLTSSIIDGSLTAVIQLEDIRVGDVIDYSWSGAVDSQLWPEDLFDAASVEWAEPLAQTHYRLLVPEGYAVNAKSIATDIEPEIELHDGWQSFRIHVRDPDPIPFEQSVPGHWPMYGFVMFTTMDSWAEVVDWALPLFSFDEPMPDEFASQLDAIAERFARPEDRAIHALRLVQSEIRYLGLEAGLGSHVPRAPSVTLSRGYGDCKDKAVLLVAALKYLGIDSVPALASVTGGELLPQLPPAIGAFDHVIVQIDFDGTKLWVDPTLSHQGGTADNVASLGYGYILPVRDGQTQLVELDEPLPIGPELEIIEAYEFPESEDGRLTISVERIYRNGFADNVRLQVATFGRQILERGMLDYYAANYPGAIVVRPFSISDDIDANLIKFEVEYDLDADSLIENEFDEYLPVFGTAVLDMLPRQLEARRTAPLALPRGLNTRHVVRVSTPGRRFPLPEDTFRSIEGVSYSRTFTELGDGVEIMFSLAVEEKTADVGAIARVTDLADEINREANLTVRTSSAIPPGTRPNGLDAPLSAEDQESMLQIAAQMEREEFVQALTGLNTLLARHTEQDEFRGLLQHLRGVALVRLNRRRPALDAFEEGFDLYEPPTMEHYFVYLDALASERELERAAALIHRMIELRAEMPQAINMDWFLRFLRELNRSDHDAERKSLILAMARAMHEKPPANIEESLWVFTEAIAILSENGDATEAAVYVPHIRSPAVFARLMTSRNTEALWDELERHAGADLSMAIDNYVISTRAGAEEAPDDFPRQTQHLAALRMTGRIEEAREFAEPIVANWPRIEAVGVDAYWFVNEYAYALSESGAPDEAFALMSRLVDVGVAANSPLISMAINRAAMLAHWHRFEDALDAVAELENLGDGYASDYGRMWIYDIKACSLYQLGRNDEAQAVLEESIQPIAESNPSAHTKTMLCLDEPDRAAEMIVERLGDESRRQSTIESFIEYSVNSDDPPFLAELLRRAENVRARPEVQAALREVGRKITINGARNYWGGF